MSLCFLRTIYKNPCRGHAVVQVRRESWVARVPQDRADLGETMDNQAQQVLLVRWAEQVQLVSLATQEQPDLLEAMVHRAV